MKALPPRVAPRTSQPSTFREDVACERLNGLPMHLFERKTEVRLSGKAFILLSFGVAYMVMAATLVACYLIWPPPKFLDVDHSTDIMPAYVSQTAHFRYGPENDPGAMNIPGVTSTISPAAFHFYVTMLMWLTVILAGFGSEAVVGLILVQVFQKHGQALWIVAQFWFSLLVLVPFTTDSPFGLLFLVVGLWKFFFPETITFLSMAHESKSMLRFETLAHWFGGLGIILHHSAASFAICGLVTHMWPHQRGMSALALPTIVQHWFAILKYQSKPLYLIASLLLEVVFEFECLSNLPRLHTNHQQDWLGRGVAATLLVSHWLYLTSGLFQMIHDTCFSRDDRESELPTTSASTRRGSVALFATTSRRLSNGDFGTDESPASSLSATPESSTRPSPVIARRATARADRQMAETDTNSTSRSDDPIAALPDSAWGRPPTGITSQTESEEELDRSFLASVTPPLGAFPSDLP